MLGYSMELPQSHSASWRTTNELGNVCLTA